MEPDVSAPCATGLFLKVKFSLFFFPPHTSVCNTSVDQHRILAKESESSGLFLMSPGNVLHKIISLGYKKQTVVLRLHWRLK